MGSIVGIISWLLFHLIWKNYILYWDFDSKSWIVAFFTRFTLEKRPQDNFSRYNFSVENNYFLIEFFDQTLVMGSKGFQSIYVIPNSVWDYLPFFSLKKIFVQVDYIYYTCKEISTKVLWDFSEELGLTYDINNVTPYTPWTADGNGNILWRHTARSEPRKPPKALWAIIRATVVSNRDKGIQNEPKWTYIPMYRYIHW